MNNLADLLVVGSVDGTFVIYHSGPQQNDCCIGYARVAATYEPDKINFRDLRVVRKGKRSTKVKRGRFYDECMVVVGSDLDADQVIACLENIVAKIKSSAGLYIGTIDGEHDFHENLKGDVSKL